jgi:hypothetical protein
VRVIAKIAFTSTNGVRGVLHDFNPEGVFDNISHEGLRSLLREEGLLFQVTKTW